VIHSRPGWPSCLASSFKLRSHVNAMPAPVAVSDCERTVSAEQGRRSMRPARQHDGDVTRNQRDGSRNVGAAAKPMSSSTRGLGRTVRLVAEISSRCNVMGGGARVEEENFRNPSRGIAATSGCGRFAPAPPVRARIAATLRVLIEEDFEGDRRVREALKSSTTSTNSCGDGMSAPLRTAHETARAARRDWRSETIPNSEKPKIGERRSRTGARPDDWFRVARAVRLGRFAAEPSAGMEPWRGLGLVRGLGFRLGLMRASQTEIRNRKRGIRTTPELGV